MCQCFQIGGPFIAEDPDCPQHGTARDEREREARSLRFKLGRAHDISDLKEIISELLDILER